MSKTYKKFIHSNNLRNQRGYKRAKIASLEGGIRKHAIPPDPWCAEMIHCKSNKLYWQVTANMYNQGIIKSVAIKKLMKKLNWSYLNCQKVINDVYKFRSRFQR